MRAIAVVGGRKSGKTTLAMGLADELKKLGLRAALAKFASHEPSLPAETEAARFRDHADLVLRLSSAGGFASWSGARPLAELVPLLHADVLVLEGGADLGVLPRIVIAPDEAAAAALGPDLALAAYGSAAVGGLLATRDVAGLARIAAREGFLLPGLDCGACGRKTCRELAADIVAGAAAPEDCAAQHGRVRIRVGGEPLPLSPLAERLLAGSLRGLLAELKGCGPGPVDIRLE